MEPAHMEDQLAQVLTDLERLVDIWVDLDNSKAACNGVTTLIAKRVEELKASNIVTASSVSSKNLERLVALKSQVHILGNNHAINISITALCGFMVTQKTVAHRVLVGTHKKDRHGRSELERCEGLSELIAIRTLIETFFDGIDESLEEINEVIEDELRSLRVRTVENHDATSLKVLELCARIRKALSETQRQFVDRIIAGKISVLKGSQSVTLDPSTKPKERLTKPFAPLAHHTEAITTQVHSEDMNKLGNNIQQLETDKKGLLKEKASLEARLWESTRKLEAEKTRYEDMLVQVRTEERQNYEALIDAFKDNKDNYDRSPMEVRRLVERLSEAEDDTNVLSKDVERLTTKNEHLETEKAHLSEEVDQLDDEVKGLTAALEEEEDDKVALWRNVHKLGDENDRLVKELADSKSALEEAKSYALTHNLDKLSLEKANLESELAEMKERLDRHKTSASAKNLAKLKVENLRQEKELANAREQLNHIQPTVDPETLRELGDNHERLEEELGCANATLDHLRSFLAQLSTVSAAYAAASAGTNLLTNLDGSNWPANFTIDQCGIANSNSMDYPWVEVAEQGADAKPSSLDGDTEICHTKFNVWRPDAPAFVPPSVANDDTGSCSFTEPTSSVANIVKED